MNEQLLVPSPFFMAGHKEPRKRTTFPFILLENIFSMNEQLLVPSHLFSAGHGVPRKGRHLHFPIREYLLYE